VISLVFTGYDTGNGTPSDPPLKLAGIPFPGLGGPGAPDWILSPGGPFSPANTQIVENTSTPGPATSGGILASVRATEGVKDSDGMQGCGKFEGNGSASVGSGPGGFGVSPLLPRNDADFVGNLNAVSSTFPNGSSLDNSTFDYNQLGPGPFDGLGTPQQGIAQDVVLRTAPLKLQIAAPGTVDTPGDNSDNPGSTLGSTYAANAPTVTVVDGSAFHAGNNITVSDGFNQSLGKVASVSGNTLTLELLVANGGNPSGLSPSHGYATGAVVSVNSDGVVHKLVGGSGGKANLFGAPVNGLANGNSVDVTVNLGTDITAIARQVDGQYPGPAGPNTANEKTGNISSYFNCRQAWTGNIRNYLTGIKLVGALRISPAITADGKVRIAKVALRTPSPVPESLAACLEPYQLFMNANPTITGDTFTDRGPQLVGGTTFNPLAVLYGSGVTSLGLTGPIVGRHNNTAAPTDRPCNSGQGPLDRDPFNVNPIGTTGPGPHGSSPQDLSSILSKGAAVGVSGNISTKIKAEVLIGSY